MKVLRQAAEGEKHQNIWIDSEKVENVKQFTYLGAVLTDSYDDTPEMKRTIAIAQNAVVSLTKIWKDKGISLITKERLLSSLLFSIASCGSECWALKESDKKRIESLELWSYRRVLRISWTTKTSNEEVLRKMQPDLRLLDSILQRKLGLVGHILKGKWN